MKRILVFTSTFPKSESDSVPGFVRDQIIAMKKIRPDTEFLVLAPHNFTSNTVSRTSHPEYEEFRFHYFWPFRFEKLAGQGIMPTLRKNPAYYFLLPFFILAEVFSLFWMIVQFKPDYIYSHWFTPQGIVSGFVGTLTATPYVYTSHSSDVAVLKKIPFFGPRIVRFFSAKAEAITVVSSRSLQKLKSFFNAQDWIKINSKVLQIPMGIHFESKSIQRSKLKNLLFIGRLVEKKGVQYLLPAFAEFCRINSEVNLQIAGDGPWRDRLEQLAIELGIPKNRIEFLGYVAGKKKEDLLSSSWAIIIPSIIASDGDSEGLPVTLLEGLSFGKICVATFESGADDILHNSVNGFLIKEKSSEEILKILKNIDSMKKNEILKIQKNAIVLAKYFEWSSIAEKHYVHLFQRNE